jgi:hypothetical protein
MASAQSRGALGDIWAIGASALSSAAYAGLPRQEAWRASVDDPGIATDAPLAPAAGSRLWVGVDDERDAASRRIDREVDARVALRTPPLWLTMAIVGMSPPPVRPCYTASPTNSPSAVTLLCMRWPSGRPRFGFGGVGSNIASPIRREASLGQTRSRGLPSLRGTAPAATM